MLEENQRLKDAIAAVASEARAEDRPELRFHIAKAATIAGIKPVAPIHTGREALSMSNGTTLNTTPCPAQPEGNDVLRQHVFWGSTAQPTGQVLSPAQNATAWQQMNQSIPAQQLPDYMYSSIPPGSLQPHRCHKDMSIVLPFVGAAAFTFSGLMFWHLVERNEALSELQTATRPLSITEQQSCMGLFQQSAVWPHASTTFWINEIKVRLTTRYAIMYGPSPPVVLSPGSSSSSSPTDGPFQQTSWLSIMDAEKRVRDIVGEAVFAFLTGPALETWAACTEGRLPGGKLEVRRPGEVVSGLLGALSDIHQCSEDGPGWDMRGFDDVVRRWCHSVIDKAAPIHK